MIKIVNKIIFCFFVMLNSKEFCVAIDAGCTSVSVLIKEKGMSLGTDKDVVRKVNSRDRGIRPADFIVIKDSVCPSVLLELDFLSNKHSEELIVQEQYREKLAQILSDGIIDYKKYLKS